jgi:hypothetical protein
MDHVAQLFAWAIERGETAGKMLALPFYPIEEGLKPALRQICDAVNAPELKAFDDSAAPGAYGFRRQVHRRRRTCRQGTSDEISRGR